MGNIWSALNETAKGTVGAYTKMKNAENEFKSQLLLAKMKSKWELEAKKEEMPLEIEKERAKKEMMNPYEKMMMEEWQKQQQGGGATQSPREITAGATGLTSKRLGLKEMAERVYMKPQETWTPRDKQIISQYQAMKQGGDQPIVDASGKVIGYRPRGAVFQPKAGGEDMGFLGGDQPTTQPTTQPAMQPQPTGKMRVKHISSGQTGTIEAGEFDPSVYEKI